ncbi:unnamed protein product, partial [Sphacelaria rigidula]
LPVKLASLLDCLERIFSLSLHQNPWEHPPESIVTGGIPAVRGYFKAMIGGGTSTVTRPLKVVIVGKETVGKTSLRHSIKAGKPCTTREGGEDSTVHVDVEDHEVDGHAIRIFDCAGQVVYYGLLQLFLTPRAVYLLVFDAGKASTINIDLEDLGIASWLRHLSFRVPDASVVLVGNKWDRVEGFGAACNVKDRSRDWLNAWKEKSRGLQPHELSLEYGVSCVSCVPSGGSGIAQMFGRGTGWPCDKNEHKNEPGLLHRITHNPDGHARAVTMDLPQSYVLALEVLEQLASGSR